MSGHEEKHPRTRSLMNAQSAVVQHPEFRGNVAFIGTRACWHPQEQSPPRPANHWNTNAETYYLIGNAMGKAMLGLVKSK